MIRHVGSVIKNKFVYEGEDVSLTTVLSMVTNLIAMKLTYILVLLILLPSCEEDSDPGLTGNYFPLNNGREWTYERWLANGPDEMIWDTVTLQVQGSSIIDGQSYSQIIDPEGRVETKVVRVEGSRYFGRHHELYGSFSHEYVFLDTDKAVGESWSYIKDGGSSKTEYVIAAINSSQVVAGIKYNDVIEVKVNYYQQTPAGNYELWLTALHYYAKDVGEIFHHYPYPVSRLYGDINAYLINDRR